MNINKSTFDEPATVPWPLTRQAEDVELEAVVWSGALQAQAEKAQRRAPMPDTQMALWGRPKHD